MVGDDDQAIYNFRGGSSEYIRSLQQRFEEKGKTVNQILLEQNYRSSKSITNCVNALIQKRLNKKMWTKNEQGSAVHVIACASPEEEADFVAQCILHIKTQGQLTLLTLQSSSELATLNLRLHRNLNNWTFRF
ncbi:DNA helicase [Balamuthia mandrillaris]